MSQVFFTSDTHFGHANIIKYCNRPFKTLDEMNNTIIRNWNSRVKPDDIVFHLGDFCFRNTSNKGEGIRVNAREWLSKLNGRIIVIKGNHDGNNSLDTPIEKLSIEKFGKRILLVHDCECIEKEELAKYNYLFCGHVHEKWLNKGKIVNVGVDVWNFKPIKFDEIMKKI